MKDIKLVNLSLLAKWRWRLVQDDFPLWKRVLSDKYGKEVLCLVDPVHTRWPTHASQWWKDLMALDIGVGTNWFNNEMVRRVGNGESTRFWKDVWIGVRPLKEVFPRLFSLSNHKDAFVGEVWGFSGVRMDWILEWRRQPFMWEVDLIESLLGLIGRLNGLEEEDRWCWRPEGQGVFTVKSVYKVVEALLPVIVSVGVLEEQVFRMLWKSPAPSKVVVFSRKLLLDRIPSRMNLAA